MPGGMLPWNAGSTPAQRRSCQQLGQPLRVQPTSKLLAFLLANFSMMLLRGAPASFEGERRMHEHDNASPALGFAHR